ncbi:MAG: hypothetical protein QF599_10345 [Planctomycetota bacterium]|jgi:hypothetical protein|nr:hypothetical protein [Planctomycetota bacterium]MDP6520832.1 hypothetical protein [Planctomycetota bacterium]MDP6956366.1 hypothetical protein [Planctomycetota bacterium]
MNAIVDSLKRGASSLDLAGHLNSMDGEARRAQVLKLPKGQLRVLFEACAGQPAALADLVPAQCTPGTTVVHLGLNSLPLFPPFEKILTRAAPGDWPQGRLWGRNQQPFTFLTGPGYFAVDPPSGSARPGFGDGTEAVFDYDITPGETPVEGWPKARDNKGLPRGLAFSGLTDVMRKVSDHLCVGAAYKRGKSLGAYFVILRG